MNNNRYKNRSWKRIGGEIGIEKKDRYTKSFRRSSEFDFNTFRIGTEFKKKNNKKK